MLLKASLNKPRTNCTFYFYTSEEFLMYPIVLNYVFPKFSSVPPYNVCLNCFLSHPSKFTNNHYDFKINIFMLHSPDTEGTVTPPQKTI